MSPLLSSSRPPRILFLDAYDSFSNNIISLVKDVTGAEVVTLKIDELLKPCSDLAEYLHEHAVDAVIAGPGPGTADNLADVGLIQDLWTLDDEHVVPVLGVCLGFQSLALAFGATIDRLKEPRHGIVTEVLHNGDSIFQELEQIQATQYHSLCANIGHSIQTKRSVTHPRQLWKPSESCPNLLPIAWDCSSLENGAILMAVRHKSKPFYGVQYHPESICTNEEGAKIVKNWWACAQAWLKSNKRWRSSDRERMSHFGGDQITKKRKRETGSPSDSSDRKEHEFKSPRKLANYLAGCADAEIVDQPIQAVHVATCGSGRLNVSDICTLLQVPEGEAVLLESGLKSDFELKPVNEETGRYSIIGLLEPGKSNKLCYYTGRDKLQLDYWAGKEVFEWRVDDAWDYIRDLMSHLRPQNMPKGASAPFWGGLMGYISYEAGLETIDVDPTLVGPGEENRPDICFAYVDRSVVIDHTVKKIYVQSIRADDSQWVNQTADRISSAVISEDHRVWRFTPPAECADLEYTLAQSSLADKRIWKWAVSKLLSHYLASAETTGPEESAYLDAIAQCQSHIRAGLSYELCLTAQTTTLLPLSSEEHYLPWALYRHLQSLNPAPFSAYVRLGGATILSSSPERFISWTRSSVASCRPIKGTVKKAAGVTREHAELILNSSKERAENLMIVDLTRHQLAGVYGGNVTVPKLMQIEEYETVWQLVSVVEARPASVGPATPPEEWTDPFEAVTPAPPVDANAEDSGLGPRPVPRIHGVDVLKASLPAGSMTGAPKKRSCELLRELEPGRRGIYAGCIGYLDVGGGGDFSVAIRTAVRWQDEVVEKPDGRRYEVWRVGAGGAVTAQSEPAAEWQEMCAKRESVMRMFEPVEVGKPPEASSSLAAKGPTPRWALLMQDQAGGDVYLQFNFETRRGLID